MPNPRLEQFAIDLHQEVLAKAGLDGGGGPPGRPPTGGGGGGAIESNHPLREEAFTEYVVGLLAEHNEADGVELEPIKSNYGRSFGRFVAFSLTLTLSRWEREPPSAAVGFIGVLLTSAAHFYPNADDYSPSPSGRGPG